LKKNDKHLTAVHSQVLQDVVLRLDKAYHAFFVGLAKRPPDPQLQPHRPVS
jgi:hypothetical protein